MNSITDILDLEDSDIHVSNIQVEGTQKLITLEYKLTSHFLSFLRFPDALQRDQNQVHSPSDTSRRI